jgi:NAD-dependent dihydropyrimidine dehydrogenase PreA subunit
MGKLLGHGFNPDVCEGCPKHTFYESDDEDRSLVERIGDAITATEEGYWGCGLCGCPTGRGLMLDISNSVPEDCVRKEQHKKP